MGQVCWHGKAFGGIGLVVMRNGAQFLWENLQKIRGMHIEQDGRGTGRDFC